MSKFRKKKDMVNAREWRMHCERVKESKRVQCMRVSKKDKYHTVHVS